LKKQPFNLIYIDAFAGTGQIQLQAEEVESEQLQLDTEEHDIIVNYCEGSVHIALDLESPFDQYVFIEQKEAHARQLAETVNNFPHLSSRIEIVHTNANDFLRAFCEMTDWRNNRCVLFLDPYGLQLEWKTLEAVAKTKAIDTWILFPHAIGVNRLLRKDGNIPEAWRERLDNMFGTSDWHTCFYTRKTYDDLFAGATEDDAKTATLEGIVHYYNERLSSIFEAVLETPLILARPQGTPLYAFCFACGNKNGADIAIRIAKHIVGK